MKEILIVIEKGHIKAGFPTEGKDALGSLKYNFESYENQGEDRYYIDDLEQDTELFWEWLIEASGLCAKDEVKLCAILMPDSHDVYNTLCEVVLKNNVKDDECIYSLLSEDENIWQEQCIVNCIEDIYGEAPRYEATDISNVLIFSDGLAHIKGVQCGVMIEKKKEEKNNNPFGKMRKVTFDDDIVDNSEVSEVAEVEEIVEVEPIGEKPAVIHIVKKNIDDKTVEVSGDNESEDDDFNIEKLDTNKATGQDLQSWINRRTANHTTTEDFFG